MQGRVPGPGCGVTEVLSVVMETKAGRTQIALGSLPSEPQLRALTSETVSVLRDAAPAPSTALQVVLFCNSWDLKI